MAPRCCHGAAISRTERGHDDGCLHGCCRTGERALRLPARRIVRGATNRVLANLDTALSRIAKTLRSDVRTISRKCKSTASVG
jgi:hypothetical protein